MPKSRFSPDEIRAVLLELESGRLVKDVSRQHGISKQTLYRWRAQYAEKTQAMGNRIRWLEIENRRLKVQVAELWLDYQSLRTALVTDVNREC